MSKDKYKRRAPALQTRNRVLILCGGETEEIYFNHFKNKHKKSLENITVKISTSKKNHPTALVDAAAAQKDSYDEVWVVFDKDDYVDFDKAISCAFSKGINCAFSNIAFEFWFFLHYERRYGDMTRNVLNAELEKRLGFTYDKTKKNIEKICARLADRLSTAEERAKFGHEMCKKEKGPNPSAWCSSTSVYILTKRLRGWSSANKK